MGKSLVSCFFLRHSVYSILCVPIQPLVAILNKTILNLTLKIVRMIHFFLYQHMAHKMLHIIVVMKDMFC